MSEEKEGPSTSNPTPSTQAVELAALDAQIAAARTQLTRIQELVDAAGTAKTATEATQAQAADALSEVQAKQAAIQKAAIECSELRDHIVKEQSAVAEKSQHIEDAKAHAEKVKKDLTKTLEIASKQATEIGKAKEQADTAAIAAKQSQELSAGAKEQADAHTASIKTALNAATKNEQKTKALADVAASIEESVKSYQESLATLEKQCKEQLAEIRRLLPGATSAGLASAFDSRGKLFTSPATRWQWIFVVALGVLVLIAAHGLWQVHGLGEGLTYGGLIRLWLSRLPIAGSLVWLALYASKEAALAKRLEEDYAYKAAVSTSFQGFQQQMREVQVDAGPETPLGKLCADTLATISSPPGRIYDKHRLTTTPTAELIEHARAILAAASNKQPSNG